MHKKSGSGSSILSESTYYSNESMRMLHVTVLRTSIL